MATVLTPDQLQTIRGRRPVKGVVKYSRERIDDLLELADHAEIEVRLGNPYSYEVESVGGAYWLTPSLIKDEPQKPLVPTKVSDDEYDEILAERMVQYELIRHGE